MITITSESNYAHSLTFDSVEAVEAEAADCSRYAYRADYPSDIAYIANLLDLPESHVHVEEVITLKVGDVITECTPDNLPVDGVAIVDAVGDVGQLDGTRLGWACGGGVTWGSSVGKRCFPMTVIYVPKAGGDE